MIKPLSIFFFLIKFLDKIIYFIFKKSLYPKLIDFCSKHSYRNIKILDRNISFYVPSDIVEYRVNTIFTKEPETINWINQFDNSEKLTFWDIGANIGLYSIYNALKNKNSKTIAFEPSTSNLRVLSRNISINNLQEDISICQIPLTNKENEFLNMSESTFEEGGALNSFGVNFDYNGKKIKKSFMNYKLLGTNIDYLIKNKILELPNYIKIDVDGIEHLILQGGINHLNNKTIKSILIEVNEEFEDQSKNVLKILKDNGFKLSSKTKQLNNIFNYIFSGVEK